MTVTCVIQARMGSSRLPGKVLTPLAGRPMLQFMLERLSTLPVQHLVVATSDRPADDAVVELVERLGGNVVRGSEHDVLDRFRLASDRFPSDQVVRLTADCPLADPDLVHAAIVRHRETGVDYLSNTLIRTYPDGLDVEVMTRDALHAAAAESRDTVEREHVTPFVYRRPERFRLGALWTDACVADHRWTIDTPSDIQQMRRMVGDGTGARQPWTSFLSAELPEVASAGPRTIRPAVCAAPEWVPQPHDDPGARVWVIARDGEDIGWVRVAVITGRGELTYGAPAAQHADSSETVRAVVAVLRLDRQVVSLALPAAARRGDLFDVLREEGLATEDP